MSTLISHYTDAVLAFTFTEGKDQAPCAATTQDIPAFTERMLKIFQKSHAKTMVLFGLEDGAHALALRDALPETAHLFVCETNTQKARDFLQSNPEWISPDAQAQLICDTSPWAHLYLLALANVTPASATLALNPALDEKNKHQYQSLQRLFSQTKPHQAINSSYLSHVGVAAPDLSVGAILSPDEPNLDIYFNQFPDWVKEVVVVWDSETIPEIPISCAVPIRHFAHPLDDFAAQRNRMLDHCEGDWVLYLDGDERFSEDVWDLFPACMLVKRLEACYFPRMTLYPNEHHTKVGYGLWPDLQLRLFKNMDGIRFERPIHERLTGIQGRTALALDAPILHSSNLLKSPDMLAAKLKRFDAAGGNTVKHLLNEEYPSIERSLFAEASLLMGALQMLLLEKNPA
ncbi:glycosyl transferase family 2 [Pseudodesulfovibrio sp. JC047]|uniref:glycosyl transferase family 2 n=1 Tax=Pseudodesulfovibrio sp. JC047 TaxID=2683199 RepID=UPI0013D62908|nr:glycosyl transferase family 2 [Pseudodesulfovibrio sp. JC047]NDV17896.1 glycosyl transferase family 2 [Pseudodesulfovibrio sp. JC047]